jgi:hypothetical protein
MSHEMPKMVKIIPGLPKLTKMTLYEPTVEVANDNIHLRF